MTVIKDEFCAVPDRPRHRHPTVNQPRTRAAAPPHPPEPGTAHDLGVTDDSLSLVRQWFVEFGDTFRVYAPSRESWTWVVSNPDDVRHVLVTNHRNYTKGAGIDRVKLLLGNGIMTSEGDFWRRQRRMMQPAFHRRVMERFARVVQRECASLVATWRAAARANERVNVTESVSRFALKVVLNAIFSDDLRELVRDLHANPFMVIAQDARRDPRFAYEFHKLERHVRALVQRRRETEPARSDLLQLLLEARDAATGERMGERELLDELLTLVVAGHETTASTLNWTWWLLARHPDVESSVYDEQAACGDLGPAAYADLSRMPYTRQVLDEALRLYPPGWMLTRRTIGADELGGYVLAPGTDVFISPYLLHRHPRHWERPDAFEPGNFAPQRVEARHAFAYIPFAVGPRHCIGENLSLYEMSLHLNSAIRQFRLTDPQPEWPGIEARINLRSAGDIHMRVETR